MTTQHESMITELLPKAEENALRDFVQQLAAHDTDFAVKLSRWLMRNYAEHANTADTYIEEVRQLFRLQELKFNKRSQWHDGEYGPDWFAIDTGMEQIAHTLLQKLANGHPEVVTAPVIEFYRLLSRELEDFLMEDDPSVNLAAKACDTLLLEWAAHPDVPAQEKREIYSKLQSLAEAEIMDYVSGLSDDFFMQFLTNSQTPEDALASIEEMAAKEKTTEALVHKHIALLRQFGRHKEALHVIRCNLRYHTVLDCELNRLYEQGDDYAALNLIDLAMAEYTNASFMEERKIRFLERIKNTSALIDVYRRILISRWNGFDYYYRLKELASPADWPQQYARIIEEATAKDMSPEFMARIYAAEKDYPALNKTILDTHYDFLSLLQEYYPQLPDEYHNKLITKGIETIEKQAERATKRPEYARIAAEIRNLRDLPGAKEPANALIRLLLNRYSHRPAFKDELHKLS